jgi:hypothetical protein
MLGRLGSDDEKETVSVAEGAIHFRPDPRSP